MGIQGLLPFLKKIHSPVNLAQFEGCTVAIDAYCWLHKGAFSCAEKLALGEKTDQYVYYCMKYIEFMLKKNIKPILVFDGCHLPSKRDVEKTRREKREVNRKKAAQLLREGKRAEARECLQRCIDISPEMALNLMNTCRARGVDCIVAPYEADAQLAFLNKAGIAQIVITEDSDLLLFGCEKVIFKMDHMGNGMMIEQKRLNEVLEMTSAGFTFDKFRYMCILSGCDYLPSLPGIGLAKACKVFKMARQDDLKMLLKKFPSTYLKMNLTVTEEYIQGFIQANNTFLYQLVYDPLKRELRPLNKYPPGVSSEDFPYAGPMISQDRALQIALGNINIYNGEKFADFEPATYKPPKAGHKKSSHLHLLSIWDKNFRIRPKQELKETQNIERPNLKGKEVVINHSGTKSVKWKRKDIEDTDIVKSNNELTEMYEEPSTKESPVKVRGENTPPSSPRRRKRSNSDSDECQLSPVKKYRKLSKSPDKFLRSLKQVDTDSPLKEADSEEECDDKENGLTSPRRNRFAVTTPTHKSRFNINASKVVKSRFFASPPLAVKEEDKECCNDDNENSLDRQEESTTDKITEVERNREPVQRAKEIDLDQKIKEESPSSAFSWSKFKFIKGKDKSAEKSKLQNSGVKSQYKRVVSDSSLKQYFSRTESKGEDSSMRTGDEDEDRPEDRPKFTLDEDNEEEVDNDTESTVSYSQRSNANSIDSFCLGNSQSLSDLSQSQGSEMKSLPSLEDLSGDDSALIIDIDASNQTTKTTEKKIASTTSWSNSKKGCRVSGLSKGKRSKSLASMESQGKQQNIKDFFSKFALTKSQPKLNMKGDTILIDEDDEENNSVTPSHTDISQGRAATSGVQRKLLS